jgi:hypothetical protein
MQGNELFQKLFNRDHLNVYETVSLFAQYIKVLISIV